jgi:hypothetical protein
MTNHNESNRMSTVRAIFGDSLQELRALPSHSFDAIVTDPPYTAAGGSTNGRTETSTGADSQFFLHWLSAVMAEVRRVVKPEGCGFVFCDWRTIGCISSAIAPSGNRQTAEVWKVGQALVWDRESIGLGSPFRNSFEMIAFVAGSRRTCRPSCGTAGPTAGTSITAPRSRSIWSRS